MAELSSFGEWLKRKRKAEGWTQEQLAKQLSCSAITLRKIEAEERRPSAQIVERLAEILKIPSSERTAFLRFARGDWQAAPAVGIEDTPWRLSTGSARSNLPVPPTPLIGREQEISDLRGYLFNPGTRLITLIGPPGIGKTRLSIEVAREALSDFAGGVFFVALAPLEDPNLVASAVGQMLGLRETQNQPPLERLKYGIGDKQMLIVLDNVEHLIEKTATLISDLLSVCPHLKILTTSREALRVPGEWLSPVPPLDVPRDSLITNVETASHFAALRLFAERARAVRPDFILNAENIQAVTSICAHLDGLPLAIELTAAYIRLMSPESLLAHLSDQFMLYADSMRAVPPRQKTLHNAIAWSYKLLSTEEQQLFVRLSVFSSGFTLEAVASLFSRSMTDQSISKVIASLLDKSLLQRASDREARGEPRFSMLVTIQQFAQQRLREIQLESETRDRHFAYFLGFAERADQHLHGPEQVEWMDRLEMELDNFRTALDWSMDKPSAEHALRLAGALGTFWSLRAYWSEGARWLDQALSKAWQANNQLEKLARSRALYHRADLAQQLDQLDALKTSAEAALALSREVEDQWGVAYSRAMIGVYLRRTGEPLASKELFEQSLNEFHNLNDVWAESFVLAWLAGISWMLGTTRAEYLAMKRRGIACARRSGDRDLLARWLDDNALDFLAECNWDQAENLVNEAEQIFTQIGSIYGINLIYFHRAMILLGRGNYEEAKAKLKQSLEYFLQAGEKGQQSQILSFLLFIAELQNDTRIALEYAYKCRELLVEIHVTHAVGITLVLGRLLYQQGDVEGGKQYMLQSLTSVKRDIDYWWPLDYVFGHLAMLFVDKQTRLAVHFLALAETISSLRPHDFMDAFTHLYKDRLLSVARAKLNEDEFTAAWEEGLKMTKEGALNLALKAVEGLQKKNSEVSEF